MNTNSYTLARLSILSTIFILLTACNLPRADSSPTLDVTRAYQTVEARLTEAATRTLLASSLPTDSESATKSPTLVVTTSGTEPATTQTPGQKCDQAAPGVPIDVTIPDDMVMQPGQNFIKTWRLKNNGTCTWTQQYSVAFFSSELMGAPASVPMPKDVPPGQTVDVSVEMVAPQEAGTFQGNWKLRNASKTWFGVGPNGDLPFWVRIVVSAPADETPTITQTEASVTGTPTGTEEGSPGVQVSGTTNLLPSDRINLDTNQINVGSGEDLEYMLIDQDLLLAPLGGVLIGVYGQSTPTLNDCQSFAMDASPLSLDDLYQGVYLCYRTDQGLHGWSRLLNLNSNNATLTMQILTWSQQ